MRRLRTDYGTIVLHWLLVVALCVAFTSGLRIATETPGRTWINLLDAVLPLQSVWRAHMQAAVVLVAVSLGYIIYLIKAGLGRRVRLDAIRLRGLLGRGQVRLGAINVVLYWAFFIAMLALIVSGGMLYFGVNAGQDAATLHWYAAWVIPGFACLHVSMHVLVGGMSQLFRILRPAPLLAPVPPIDVGALLTLVVEQSALLTSQPVAKPARSREPKVEQSPTIFARAEPFRSSASKRMRRHSLQANPLAVAAAVAISSALMMVAVDHEVVDHLQVHWIANAEAPVLDGDTSDRIWRNITPVAVITNHGGNFDGKGETRIEIRAVHDNDYVYFLFVWNDPTRSLKHLPLIKDVGGWHLLHHGYENGDEYDYNEDKFSVLFTTSDVSLAGDRTFHAGPRPIPDAPATLSGRGLHYSAAGYADVWLWKATSHASGRLDDSHFGPPLEPTPLQVKNITPYKGGFKPDPGSADYRDNFDPQSGTPADHPITPIWLPKNMAAIAEAMRPIDFDPDHGESEGSRWSMADTESVPYSANQDNQIPLGSVIPGVIRGGVVSGDRGDVRCAARWAAGHWALEVARRIDTGSQFDVPIRTGVFMRVAAFDHSQIRHTRHVRPIRLEVE
jgi:hypothetical protein